MQASPPPLQANAPEPGSSRPGGFGRPSKIPPLLAPAAFAALDWVGGPLVGATLWGTETGALLKPGTPVKRLRLRPMLGAAKPPPASPRPRLSELAAA